MQKSFNVSEIKDITDDGFIKHEKPVLENFRNLYNAKVVKVEDKDYPYRMWIFGETVYEGNPGFDGYDAIFYGRGKSLGKWEMYCGNNVYDSEMRPEKWIPVMTAGKEIFDSFHNGDPSVEYINKKFYMAFSSVGLRVLNGKNYIVNCIMGAVSDDGIHWIKSEKPLLIWDKEYVNGWEADKPIPPGCGGYHRPSLLFDEDKWKIWFDYYLPGTFLSMGYAENEGDFLDADSWKILNAEHNPQLTDWPNPAVIRIKDTYYSFSDVPGFDTSEGNRFGRQIVMATSSDGFDWKVKGKITPENDKFGTHLPEPFLEEINGDLWLYIFYSMVEEQNLPCYSKLNYIKKQFKYSL